MTNRRHTNYRRARERLSSSFACAECEGVPALGCWECTAHTKGVLEA